MSKQLLLPSGTFATGVVTECVTGAYITGIDDFGPVNDYEHGDFPDMTKYDLNGRDVVYDRDDGTEFLHEHCRLVELEPDTDPSDYEDRFPIQPWPDHIIAACLRVKRLHEVPRGVELLRQLAPEDWGQDPTIEVVLQTVLVGRAEAEIDALEATIAEFRKSDPEVVLPSLEEAADAKA